MNATCLWSRAQFAVNKRQKYFLLPDHQHAENLILVFGFYKRKNKDKREFVTKYAEIICNYVHEKNISQIAGKTFVTQCFHTDRLTFKSCNKITRRALSANPR